MTAPSIQLLLGGARSGKSRLAEQYALELHKKQENVAKLIYLATATAGDSEMKTRIDNHQARRDKQWRLIEEPIDIANVIQQSNSNTTILIDCLTLWLSNCLHVDCWSEQRDKLINALNDCQANVVMVSNEVGSGVIPKGELSRTFVDESGWLHQELATLCTKVTLVVAGLPMILKEVAKK